MPSFKVKVKWGKELLDSIELNTDEPPVIFKAQLYQLTGVAPDRQKIMAKGVVLKDDSWTNVPIKDGLTLMMMGSVTALPSEPREKPNFMEDMSEQQLSSALQIPGGLKNLGNTCYLNATIQCLKSVPELKKALEDYNETNAADSSVALTASIRDAVQALDKNEFGFFIPIAMVNFLHKAFPRFAEQAPQGGFMQQDANECWIELMRTLKSHLKDSSTPEGNVIDTYFGGKFEVTMSCKDAPEETPVKTTEDFLQLSCFISQDVKYLQSGLKLRLEETLSKMSPTLGVDAQYTKTSLISRLPQYLTVQMVRFQFKAQQAVNAKILKDIKFPIDNLDVFELCSQELQSRLLPMRIKYKEAEEKKAELEAAQRVKGAGPNQTSQTTVGHISSADLSVYSFPEDKGSNNSGFYDLVAVLTHKGRSSSSGHYVGWIRHRGAWFMCDDEDVEQVTSEHIARLSGGGDWHTAYVLLYGPRLMPAV